VDGRPSSRVRACERRRASRLRVSGAGLRTLRLGLSRVKVVALSLPHLTSLNLDACCDLSALELRCPALLAAFLQSCRLGGGASRSHARGCWCRFLL
jgi:hypothetical protein